MTAPLCTSSLDPQIPPRCFLPTDVGALPMRIIADTVLTLGTIFISTSTDDLGTKSK